MAKHAKTDASRPAYAADVNLAAHFGVSRATIWRWAKTDPTFPQPVKLSPQCSRWKMSEITAWEQAKQSVAA